MLAGCGLGKEFLVPVSYFFGAESLPAKCRCVRVRPASQCMRQNLLLRGVQSLGPIDKGRDGAVVQPH
jgi:hypothetical protein